MEGSLGKEGFLFIKQAHIQKISVYSFIFLYKRMLYIYEFTKLYLQKFDPLRFFGKKIYGMRIKTRYFCATLGPVSHACFVTFTKLKIFIKSVQSKIRVRM